MSRMKKRRGVRRKKHRVWQLQEAKARFSELVNEVIEDGYHTITKNGRPVVVVLSQEEFEQFKMKKNTLGEFLSASPFSTFEVDIERDKDLGRDLDL